MVEKVESMVIKYKGKTYEFSSGSGTPAPDSVGSEQIKDDSVMMEDLNTEVKDKITNTYDASNERLTLGNVIYKTAEAQEDTNE